jgi:hypothetical protein
MDPLAMPAHTLDTTVTMKLCLASSVYAVGGSMQTSSTEARQAREVRSGGARHREAPRQNIRPSSLPTQLDVPVGKALLVSAAGS